MITLCILLGPVCFLWTWCFITVFTHINFITNICKQKRNVFTTMFSLSFHKSHLSSSSFTTVFSLSFRESHLSSSSLDWSIIFSVRSFSERKYNCYVSHQLKNNKNTEKTITSVDFVLNKRHVRFLHTVEGADVMIDDRDLLTLTTGTVTQKLYSRS